MYHYAGPTCLDQGLSKHQEVGSTPVTKVTKFIVNFWDLIGAIKKYILWCGSNELLVSNVAHKTKEKLKIQNKFSLFFNP